MVYLENITTANLLAKVLTSVFSEITQCGYHITEHHHSKSRTVENTGSLQEVN